MSYSAKVLVSEILIKNGVSYDRYMIECGIMFSVIDLKGL